MGLIDDELAKSKRKGVLDVPSIELLRDEAQEPVQKLRPAPAKPGVAVTRMDILDVLQDAPSAMLPAWDPMLATGTPRTSTRALEVPGLPGDTNVQCRTTAEAHLLMQAFNNLQRNNGAAGIPDWRAITRYSLHIWRLVYGPEILARYQQLPNHLAALPPDVRHEVERCTWKYHPKP